ncbi:hypothetical protein [Streptomyces subrutilus]|uniref:hypothetical protein n=1 Tax=Streptomyces subrutilus TaxID=36818 RepID=UPI0034031009
MRLQPRPAASTGRRPTGGGPLILRLSGRLPVLVSTLAEAQPQTVEEIGDPSGTAVERFLKFRG